MKNKSYLFLFILSVSQVDALAVGYADRKCNPDSEIQEKLNIWRELRERAYTKEDWFQTEVDHSVRLARQYPNDMYIQREIDTWIYRNPARREKLIAERESQYRTDPDDVLTAYLYARLLVFERSLQAVQILEKVLQKNPRFAQARLLLAQVYRNQQKKPGSAAEIEQIRIYRGLCPENVEGYLAMRGLQTSGYVSNEISSLKSRLDDKLTPAELGLVKAYWELAFSEYPPEAHRKIREQVGIWLTRLKQYEYPWSLVDLQTFIRGFAVAQNLPGKTWADDALLAKFPGTDSARAVLDDRWQDDRERLQSSTGKLTDAKPDRIDELKQVDRLIELAPLHPQLLFRKFLIIREMESTTNGEILALGKLLKERMQSTQGYMPSNPPPSLAVADEYVARGIGLDQIVGLVTEAFNSISRIRKDVDSMFAHNREGKNNFLADLDSTEILGLCLIAEATASLGDKDLAMRQIDLARSILAKYSLVDPSDRRYGIYNSALARYQRALAMLEMVNGKNRLALETLLIAEGSAKQSSSGRYWTTRNVIAERIEILEAQLGKTRSGPETGSDLGRAPKTSVQKNTWLEYNVPFPSVTLTDLEGKVWHSNDWRGKIVFLNLWATWCGPCRVELPLIQALRDKYAERHDVIFVTVNIDEDLSLLVPFLKKFKVTLPVLLVGHKRESLLGTEGGVVPSMVPVSLILDEKGIVRKRQLGFENDEQWLASSDAALNTVSTENRSLQQKYPTLPVGGDK